jgi:hypothetical protein
MLATVLRGLRSRALLSAGSELLTALAVGSAVLGPIFQSAVTNSYLVTRLNEAPNNLTGLSWVFQPDGPRATATDAQAAAAAAVADAAGPFGPPRTQLETVSYDFVPNGKARLLGAADACAHLTVDGDCPDAPGEVLLLKGDLERNLLDIGDRIDLPDPVGTVRVVGSYRAPDGEDDFWFDLQRFASIPAFTTAAGLSQPYKAAPFVTVPEMFDDLPTSQWTVRVQRLLVAPPDLTLDDLDVARATAADLREEKAVRAGDGRLVPDTLNDLELISAETREQQATARSSITPAVISLVLVAMALLLRLLMAAADLRLPELALASLRGLSRRQLWSLGLSEPLALLAISVPVGGAVGVGLSLGLVRWWLVPGLPLPLPAASVVAGLVVVVASLLVAVLAVSLVLRVSLSEQLTGVRRPHASGRFTIIGQLVLVATALSVLVSKLSVGKPGKPDVTDLVLPVLLAVVAGLAASRATAGLATWWTKRRRRTRSLPSFVAARAISRRQEGTLVILPVTAAIAICVFGAGVYDSAASWRASVAATTSPAGAVWTSPTTLRRTVALTHELDPDGDYLMAASTISTLGPTYAVLDTPRLARVAAWQDQWTPGVGPAEIADGLGLQARIPRVRGSEIGLTVDNRARIDGDLHVRVRLDVLGGRPHYVFLGPFPEGETTTLTGSAPYCRGGCSLDAMTLGGPAALQLPINGVVAISDLTVDGEPLEGGIDGAGWTAAPGASAGDLITGVSDDGETLTVETASGNVPVIVQLSSGSLPDALPVVRGVDAPVGSQAGSVGATSSETEFPTSSITAGHSIPLLGPTGVLIDYTMLTSDRDIYPQDVPVYVLARTDTPVEITDALRDRGLFVSSTLAGTQHTLDQGAYALALRLYAVVALLVLVMALAGLFVSTAVQLPARRRDAASLRVVGVPRRSVMSAVLRELAVVLGATALAGLAAGTLAQYVVLRTVTLGVVDNVRTPALVASIDPQRLVLLALAAGLLFGAVALVSAAMTVRGARGSTLRENAR